MQENKWYALRTKPHKERVLHQQVVSRKIECFFPRVKINPINPRSAKIRPYFPGYMFVNVDITVHGASSFQWMPYSLGLVCSDDEPGPIPDEIILALKKRITQIRDNGGLVFDQLHPGMQVRITGGPFRGYEAIFDTRLDGQKRVRVLLQLINHRQIPIEMQVGQIAKKT
ncbi:MAG: hypothetical protein IH859_03305 [Chloroflexi bacterium]|nr:hypothetical protein [Chloroflexota bacterium]